MNHCWACVLMDLSIHFLRDRGVVGSQNGRVCCFSQCASFPGWLVDLVLILIPSCEYFGSASWPTFHCVSLLNFN